MHVSVCAFDAVIAFLCVHVKVCIHNYVNITCATKGRVIECANSAEFENHVRECGQSPPGSRCDKLIGRQCSRSVEIESSHV